VLSDLSRLSVAAAFEHRQAADGAGQPQACIYQLLAICSDGEGGGAFGHVRVHG